MILKLGLLLVAAVSFAGFILVTSAVSADILSRRLGRKHPSILTRGFFRGGKPPPFRYALALLGVSVATLYLLGVA